MTRTNITVLIIDDDRDVCQLLSFMVQAEGLSPIVAYDGVTGLARMQMEHPNVLLVDLRMRGIDGMEVMRRAKALDEDVPVILMTGHAEIREAMDTKWAGATRRSWNNPRHGLPPGRAKA